METGPCRRCVHSSHLQQCAAACGLTEKNSLVPSTRFSRRRARIQRPAAAARCASMRARPRLTMPLTNPPRPPPPSADEHRASMERVALRLQQSRLLITVARKASGHVVFSALHDEPATALVLECALDAGAPGSETSTLLPA